MNKQIIKTEILLSDDGKEFDLGRAIRTPMHLSILSKEEALDAYDAGKRVYFVYENERTHHCNCRKVCKNRQYLTDHYTHYHEACGIPVKKNLVTQQ